MTPEVEAAVEELREAFPDSSVTATPDAQGGAAVTVDPVDLGNKYSPPQTWVKFSITFQYPVSDVYPHFVRSDITRVDGAPLGEGTSATNVELDGQMQAVIQLSRKSSKLNPTTDTAALKLEKVLTWMRDK